MRVIRHMTFDLIYQKKNNVEYFITHFKPSIDNMGGLKDQDLMVDMRFGDPKYYQNVFKANAAKNVEIDPSEMKMKKLMA